MATRSTAGRLRAAKLAAPRPTRACLVIGLLFAFFASVDLAAAELELAGEVGERVFPRILAEFERTREQVLRIRHGLARHLLG